MRRVGASFIAMAAGWAAMNSIVIGWAWIIGLVQARPVSPVDLLTSMAWWLMISAMVVGVAWLVVYLPVYCFVKRSSGFWAWNFCVPFGVIAGALIPFGLYMIPLAFQEGNAGGLLFLLLPAMVGGVAAAVGRYLLDWSRNYADVMNSGTDFGGIRI